jgi:cell division protein FtsQ
MDGRGRLAQPRTRKRQCPAAPAAAARLSTRPQARQESAWLIEAAQGRRPIVGAWLSPRARLRPPRYAGVAASALFLFSVILYGVAKGGHVPTIVETLSDLRDAVANAAGFGIAGVSVSGHKHVSRAEILAAAGVTGRNSLLFLSVEAARGRLKALPWIADASVRKLYPDRLLISVVEREAFALWQLDGKVVAIAGDGTVLGTDVNWRLASLPFVVGPGAHRQAKDFLALLDRYPAIRDHVRASVLVAERRWNLKLKNGIDVRLPAIGVEQALETLVGLDRDKRLITRDIAAIDLRLPDRVTVRLSDAAAQAREGALREKKAKRKGGDA